MKKEHKFFDIFLDNDLDKLHQYLILKRNEILDEKVFKLTTEEKEKYSHINGVSTQLAHKYNVFDFDVIEIQKLKNGLNQTLKNACDYYEVDYDKNNFIIHGWFNIDYKTTDSSVSPINKNEHFHDHMEGVGSPVFHGYYCVNAEPSSTYYKIDNKVLFENINKNNRAIISETGHPHGRDDWYEDKERITIAYDIVPIKFLTDGDMLPPNWCYL